MTASFRVAILALLAGCAHRAPAPVPAPPLPPEPVAAPAPPPRVLRIARPEGSEPSPIFSVQIDEKRVYFNDGTGRLWAAPKDGTAAAEAIVDDPHDSVRSFVLAGDTIYYAGRRELRSVPAAGGPSQVRGASRAGPILLVSDGAYLYHTVFDGSATFRVSLADGRSDRFCKGGKHQTLAVDATHLYTSSYTAGTITAVSKKTRRSKILVAGVRRPVRLVVDDRWVYFTTETDGAVQRVAKQGGPVEVLARAQSDQEHLALDGDHLYWATRTAGGAHALVRASKDGEPGELEELYVGLRSAGGLAVDDDYVYVADRGAGEIVRVRKE